MKNKVLFVLLVLIITSCSRAKRYRVDEISHKYSDNGITWNQEKFEITIIKDSMIWDYWNWDSCYESSRLKFIKIDNDFVDSKYKLLQNDFKCFNDLDTITTRIKKDTLFVVWRNNPLTDTDEFYLFRNRR